MNRNTPIVLGSVVGFLLVMSLKACIASANVPGSVAARLARGSLNERALTRAGQDMTDAVVLARVCAKESGLDGLADCAAIRLVLERVGRGDVGRGARLYSPCTFMPEHLGRRPWIAYLNRAGSQPRMWPSHLSWSAHRNKWLALVSHAHALLRDRPLPCVGVRHWGAPHGEDLRRALAFGWRRINCDSRWGRTKNAYWGTR